MSRYDTRFYLNVRSKAPPTRDTACSLPHGKSTALFAAVTSTTKTARVARTICRKSCIQTRDGTTDGRLARGRPLICWVGWVEGRSLLLRRNSSGANPTSLCWASPPDVAAVAGARHIAHIRPAMHPSCNLLNVGSRVVIAKFHYTDTDPNGPARTQRSFAAKKSVSVSV